MSEEPRAPTRQQKPTNPQESSPAAPAPGADDASEGSAPAKAAPRTVHAKATARPAIVLRDLHQTDTLPPGVPWKAEAQPASSLMGDIHTLIDPASARRAETFLKQRISYREELHEIFSSIESKILMGATVAFIIAMIAGSFIVILLRMQDWFMYTSMYFVIVVTFLMYIKSRTKGHRYRPIALWGLTLSLLLFWTLVLFDRSTPQHVLIDDEVVLSEGHRILYIPVVLQCLASIGLILHRFFPGKRNAQ